MRGSVTAKSASGSSVDSHLLLFDGSPAEFCGWTLDHLRSLELCRSETLLSRRLHERVPGAPTAAGPALWIRVAHQPNVLAYWKLLGQLVQACALADRLRAEGTPTEIAFVAVDYDSVRDERLRRAVLPGLGRSGDIGICIDSRRRVHGETIAACCGPDRGWSEDVAARIRRAGDPWLHLVDKRHRRALGNAVSASAERTMALLEDCESYGAAGVRFIVDFIERLTGERLHVLSGTAIMRALQPRLREVLSDELADGGLAAAIRARIEGDPRAAQSGLLWAWCACGVRIPLTVRSASRSINLRCPGCESTWRWDEGLLLPRVLLDEILDGEIYNDHLALSHVGGLSHLTASHRVRDELGLNTPFLEVASHARYEGPCLVSGDFGHIPLTPAQAWRAERSRTGMYSGIYYDVCLDLADPEMIGP